VKPGRRVWFLSDGKRREGILLSSDDLRVVIKEDGRQLPNRKWFRMLPRAQQGATSREAEEQQDRSAGVVYEGREGTGGHPSLGR
jgi:hypothetical protein